VQWVECPRGWACHTWLPCPSTPPLMSSAPAASIVPESARLFPSLILRLAALLAARPLMSSEPAASIVPESSGARPYPSPPEAGMQWVECPRGRAGRTWFSWLSTPLLMSSASVVSTVSKSSGARPFSSLLDRSPPPPFDDTNVDPSSIAGTLPGAAGVSPVDISSLLHRHHLGRLC
jgi:hypothetical protein